jgi:hypothetical protein
MTVPTVLVTVGRVATNLNPHHGTPNPRAFSLKTEVQMPRSIRSRVQRDLIANYQIGTRKANEVINWVYQKMGWPDDRPGYTRKALYGATSQRLKSQKIPLREECVTLTSDPFSKSIRFMIEDFCREYPDLKEDEVEREAVQACKTLVMGYGPQSMTNVEDFPALRLQIRNQILAQRNKKKSEDEKERPNYQWMWEKLFLVFESDDDKTSCAIMNRIEDEGRKKAQHSQRVEELQLRLGDSLVNGPSISMLHEGPTVESCWIHFSDGAAFSADLPLKEVKTILGSMAQEWVSKL